MWRDEYRKHVEVFVIPTPSGNKTKHCLPHHHPLNTSSTQGSYPHPFPSSPSPSSLPLSPSLFTSPLHLPSSLFFITSPTTSPPTHLECAEPRVDLCTLRLLLRIMRCAVCIPLRPCQVDQHEGALRGMPQLRRGRATCRDGGQEVEVVEGMAPV